MHFACSTVDPEAFFGPADSAVETPPHADERGAVQVEDEHVSGKPAGPEHRRLLPMVTQQSTAIKEWSTVPIGIQYLTFGDAGVRWSAPVSRSKHRVSSR